MALEATCDVGLYGLAVMGQNFALNMASKGFRVAVCNRSPEKVDITVTRAADEGELPLQGFKDPADFVASIKRPRRVMMLVMAGKPVDDTISLLSLHLEEGDVLVDGGNEWFPNTIRRGADLKDLGIHFVGMGVSGGEDGARHGSSLMPGCDKVVFDLLEPILNECAAQVGGDACTTHCGPLGAGNYVKMVHNGIEYGDMQLIAEVYDALKVAGGLDNEALKRCFEDWNESELQSYLIEITAVILGKETSDGSGAYVVDQIVDQTGMKGTGRWTVQEAAEQSAPCPTLTSALDARYLSARKEERVEASITLLGPSEIPQVDIGQLVDDAKQALYMAKVCSYAQGMELIRAASEAHDWQINRAECARIWKGGCIIRAAFLDRIQAAFTKNPDLSNLMMDSSFAAELNSRQLATRRFVTLAMSCGVPVPALSASLCYFDSYRRARLPANLTQAQRDFFGGHSYKKVGEEGDFHTAWTDAHHDLGSLKERNTGNL